MDKEKQIEEMAKALYASQLEKQNDGYGELCKGCRKWEEDEPCEEKSQCNFYKSIAEYLYNAGCRKAASVVEKCNSFIDTVNEIIDFTQAIVDFKPQGEVAKEQVIKEIKDKFKELNRQSKILENALIKEVKE